MTCLTAACLALGLHAIASASAELGGGMLSNRGGNQGELSFTQLLQPTVGLVHPTSRGVLVRTSYSPRAFWRYPNTLNLSRPAILHGFDLAYQPLLLPRTTLGASANVQFGEVDYTAVPEVFGDDQTLIPEDPFVRLLNAQLSLQGTHELSRRWDLELRLPFTHTSVLSNAEAATLDTNSASLLPSLTHQLTRRDRLGLSPGAALSSFALTDQLALRGVVDWAHVVSRRVSSSTSVGIGRIEVLRNDSVDPERRMESGFFAIGAFTLSHRRQHGSENLTIGVDALGDAVAQTIRPRANVAGSVTQTLAPKLTLLASVSGYTSTDTQPLPSEPEETGLGANLALSWAMAPWQLRGGLRGTVRGPHWSVGFDARQYDAIAFFGATWTLPERH